MGGNDNLMLKIENISKRYGGLVALNGVRLDVRRGEVHAVVGENGAGKSTLMNILGGIVRRDSGTVFYKGNRIEFESPSDAMKSGVSLIHQELSMLPSLNVMENIFMGRMDSRCGFVRWRGLWEKARDVLTRVGLSIDPRRPVSDLSISERQLVEIAKALSLKADLLIMDEPNSSLTKTETLKLFEVIGDLKRSGVSILYVSHKLDEVLRISDRISVLRDGRYVNTIDKAEATADKIIGMMVGRKLEGVISRKRRSKGGIVLEARRISGIKFKDVSFAVGEGEILGFAGLVGAGRSEVARAVFGADPLSSGQIVWRGKAVRFRSPAEAVKHGLAFVPEDRKEASLFMGLPIGLNITITRLPKISRYGVVSGSRVRKLIEDFARMLKIKMFSPDYPVSSLSGGNQQKVVLSRWLATEPKLLMLDEPTHGIDVGAKAEIYKLMRKLTAEGISIMLISSELPEIITMSDRVVVLHEGRVTAVLNREEISEERIMYFATRARSEDEGRGRPQPER